jgi:hypothetical protein
MFKITAMEKQFILQNRILAMSDKVMIYEELKSKPDWVFKEQEKSLLNNLMGKYKIDKNKAKKILDLFKFVDTKSRVAQKDTLIKQIEKIIGG